MKFNKDRYGPTEKQIDLMDELGIEYDEETTKQQARELIEAKLEEEREARDDWG